MWLQTLKDKIRVILGNLYIVIRYSLLLLFVVFLNIGQTMFISFLKFCIQQIRAVTISINIHRKTKNEEEKLLTSQIATTGNIGKRFDLWFTEETDTSSFESKIFTLK